MARRHTHHRRIKAAHFPEAFRRDVLATIRAHRELCETDLMDSLRGSMFWTKPVGVESYWSFGAYDFRALIGRMVADGLLEKVEGQQRGGGVQTTYLIGKDADG